MLHLFTLLGPRPPPAQRRVLRPPSSSSILAARSSECPRTFNSSSPTRREQNGTPSQRPLPHHRDGEQACTTHSPYPSAIFVACSSCCLCTELQKHNPGSAPSAMAPRCAQGMGGGMPRSPVAADLARLLPPLFIRPESTPRPPCSSPRPVSSSQVCRLLSASVLPGPSLHNAFCDFVTSRPSLCHSELRSVAPPCLGLPPPFPPHGPDLASPRHSVL